MSDCKHVDGFWVDGTSYECVCYNCNVGCETYRVELEQKLLLAHQTMDACAMDLSMQMNHGCQVQESCVLRVISALREGVKSE